MEEVLDIVHKTIYQFFDECGDNEEVPMSDKDKLLLKINKAICNNLKALEQQMGYWIVTKKEKISYAECSVCGALYPMTEGTYDFSSAKFCPNCGLKMMGSEDK